MTAPDFEEDANIPTADLGEVTRMAERMISLSDEIAKEEAKTKLKKDELARIETGDLPDLMDSVNMGEFTLKDGTKIKTKDIIKGALPTVIAINKQKNVEKRAEMKERHDAGLEFLRNNNADSLIINQLVVDIAKGQDNMAEDIIGYIEETHGLEVQRNTSVNAATLSAYIREKLNKGDEIPFDTFSVFSGRKATITKPR